jgi:ApaG protein
MYDSQATTRGVTVSVKVSYIPERSDPHQGNYFFAYHIRIFNEGDETVQLLTRHWVITDASGHVEEVRGPGVVGKQPVLEPGESFEYTSFCPLPTPFGTMEGSYQMVTGSGAAFDAEVARFALAQPMVVN